MTQGIPNTTQKFVNQPMSEGPEFESIGSKKTDYSETNNQSALEMVGKNQGNLSNNPDLPIPPASNRMITLSTDQALSNLSATQVGADSFALMQLMTLSLREQRTFARQTRTDELQSELKARHGVADQIRKSIPARMWGGIISGGMTAIGGAFALGGAAKSATASTKTLKNAMDTKPNFDMPSGKPLASPGQSPSGSKVTQQGIELQEMKQIAQPTKKIENPLSTEADKLHTTTLDSQVVKTDKSTSSADGKQLTDLKERNLGTSVEAPSKSAGITKEKSIEERKIEALEMENWHKDLANQLHKDSHSATKGEGVSRAFSGSGTSIHAYAEGQASENDAKKVDEETTAKSYEAAYQNSNDLMNQAQDLNRDLREKLAAIVQSEVETTRAINRNI